MLRVPISFFHYLWFLYRKPYFFFVSGCWSVMWQYIIGYQQRIIYNYTF